MADTLISEFIIDKEMGYSKSEFLNQFKLFAIELRYTISGDCITIFPANSLNTFQNALQLIITLSEQTDRHIGSLNIPRLFVNFQFTNYTQIQVSHFLKQFDLSFQRGGG